MTTITDYIPADKLLHISAGIIIAMVVTPLSNPEAGIVVALLAGLCKELIIDTWLGMGEFDKMDFWATVGGGMIGTGIAYVQPMIGKLA